MVKGAQAASARQGGFLPKEPRVQGGLRLSSVRIALACRCSPGTDASQRQGNGQASTYGGTG